MSSQRSITILFLGDVIGKPGRAVIKRYLKEINPKADLIIANVENAAHGFGTTQSNVKELKEAGIIAFTGGNHTFDRRETIDFIDQETNLLRPANYPEGTPGHGMCLVEVGKHKVGILNLIGRVFMEPLRSPFAVADQLLPELKKETNIIFVDFHAEATAEKIAMGWYLDGRASAMVGTHTHVQTADERILPNGTAYITDAGCCGPYEGVIGMEREGVFRRMVQQLPTRLEVAAGPAMANGVEVEIDVATGKALTIKRVHFHEEDSYSN
jgi:metallophosphoesterase (TIGR00282 family)